MTPAAAAIESFLQRAEITYQRLDDGRWAAQLRGERKLTIPLFIALVGDRVVFESFFMRRPQENAAAFYELLLRRNRRSYGVAFAVDAEGDVSLVGQRAAAGLDEDELDRIVGSVLTEADGLFNAAIAVGFESYLAADMAWRARADEQPG
jgi:hypothetical protein